MDFNNELWFNGSSDLLNAHEELQSIGGNATFFSEFRPSVVCPRRIAERLLCLLYRIGFCCAIIGEFAVYVSGMFSTPPDYITVYMAINPQNLFHQVNVLLQIEPTAAFSMDDFDFLFFPTFSTPGHICYYVVRLGVESAVFRFVRVNSLEICGPRSNVDFVHFIWDNFSYYCANYTITVLPMQTSANKILYARFTRPK
jgi:hypothetical protein